MDFTVFDKTKIEEYEKQAKEQWGNTEAFAEFEQKSKGRSEEETKQSWAEFMQLFAEFGKLMDKKPEEEAVQKQVKKVQDYITEHFYKCTNEILQGLGKMYAANEEFKENIDRAGGEGCAQFISEAIAVYCK